MKPQTSIFPSVDLARIDQRSPNQLLARCYKQWFRFSLFSPRVYRTNVNKHWSRSIDNIPSKRYNIGFLLVENRRSIFERGSRHFASRSNIENISHSGRMSQIKALYHLVSRNNCWAMQENKWMNNKRRININKMSKSVLLLRYLWFFLHYQT